MSRACSCATRRSPRTSSRKPCSPRSSGSGFSGKSSLRTWLTGILKHKIVDAIRKKQREPTVASAFGDIESEMDIEDFDAMFNERGGWDPKPADWGNPEEALNQRQFLDVMDLCLEKLPPNTARVFMMREVMELETDEICKELTINANNLWVILYRARMALRQCLEQNWFARTLPPDPHDLPTPPCSAKPLGHIISCKDASRLVSRREEAPLSAWQRLVLRLHLSVCAACSRFEKQIAFLRNAMQKYRQ